MKFKQQKKNVFEILFLHDKPVKMLTSLRSDQIQYATQVSKYVDCTYSHTVKVLEMFKDLGLVQFEKKGRVKMIKLTGEGEEIAHHFEGLRKKFDNLEKDLKIPQQGR
ncbi:MAG: winged helix DNA-binding protein [Candidatus Aenigmatarchaeota archaeon]